ncbi:MAG TPA: hypothetical protein VKU42_09170, partial [Candidatus Angelobacter sp.]|nr:hypothetical protein [Candidatus Angelobacter sp.]
FAINQISVQFFAMGSNMRRIPQNAGGTVTKARGLSTNEWQKMATLPKDDKGKAIKFRRNMHRPSIMRRQSHGVVYS